ncbi:hypothetical protein [Stenotrophomonas sp. TWI587]|uniref:hypothetical protein n=1 Tax=Stenotrophomonas sp. TWI587 TaxID=3136783 RepID=UPI00320B169E
MSDAEAANAQLPLIVHELRNVFAAVESTRGSGNDPIQRYGWNAPGVTPWDIGMLAADLAGQIESELPFEETAETAALLEAWPAALQHIASGSVPHLLNGNAPSAAIAIVSTLSALRMVVNSVLGWSELRDRAKMPQALRRKLTGIEASINAIVPDANRLTEQVATIKDAAEAAYDLPVSLDELKRARAQISADADAVKERSTQAAAALQSSTDILAKLESAKLEADALVAKVRESQRITTSIGLAAAFDEKARSLGVTLGLWVGILVISLSGAAVLTAYRWQTLTKLAEGEPNWPAVALQVFLSALSLAGPGWLAWLATKQIGQRFKMAEDYAFKASVAKAYEGYRREAELLEDSEMAARLFDSALARLDEAPLRFLDSETHGSPWHEFAQTTVFRDASARIPGFVDSYRNFFKKSPRRRGNSNEEINSSSTED